MTVGPGVGVSVAGGAGVSVAVGDPGVGVSVAGGWVSFVAVAVAVGVEVGVPDGANIASAAPALTIPAPQVQVVHRLPAGNGLAVS